MFHLTASGVGTDVVSVAGNPGASRDLVEAYLTAFAMIGDRARTLASGDGAYVSTHIDSRTFASEIRKFLASTA